MGGRSSKSSKSPTSLQLQQHAQLQQQIERDLDRKRPSSRRIVETWNTSQAQLPAYAMETLDEEQVLVVRPSYDLEADGPLTQQQKRRSSASSDGSQALVYVFNPDRVTSRRVSKRISSRDESLILERMSQSTDRHAHSNIMTAVPSGPAELPQFSMVHATTGNTNGMIKSCDASVVGRTGSTQTGEGRHLCQDEAHFEVFDDCIVFGVFDGHGPDGHLIAAICAKELASCIRDDQAFYFSQNDVNEAIKGGMASLQRRLDEIPPNRADVERSGTTATIGYITPGGKVWIANVGDSRAIGARPDKTQPNKFAVVKLSDEHIFSIESEAERVVACGGRVAPIMIDGRPIGPPRCWYGYEDSDAPGLMVSRSLGDSVARRIGVNAECSLYQDQDLAFVIVASDGLWEVMNNEEAIGVVAAAVVKNVAGAAISELLCLEAKRRWNNLEGKCGDDISALVVVF